MNRKTETGIKSLAIAVTIAFMLFIGIAMAESSAREKVVQEACYALDGGRDTICGDMTKVGNWNWLNWILKNNPQEGRFFICGFFSSLFNESEAFNHLVEYILTIYRD
ncbi:hypothetical protein KKB43_03825 [Patescibacteria group bacterium]|nr:hypothetical protein [Patescibacteria group bacterium]